jgi:UDP-glucose 4-epimerase
MAVHLVTGGGGFIGSHLVEALVAQGHAVRVLDDFSTGSRANLAAVEGRVELLEAGLGDAEALRRATAGADFVFHLAAFEPALPHPADPLRVHHAAAAGTLQMLLAARAAGVRRVIYAASASAYGNQGQLPCRERDLPRPCSPAAVATLAGEYYCETFSRLYGLETVRLRYFDTYGPRQPADCPDAGVVNRVLRALLEGRRPELPGGGSQCRDFIYVADAVQAALLAAQAQRVTGKVYNVAYGRGTTLLQLVRLANDVLGTALQPITSMAERAGTGHRLADISLAQAELGFCPWTDLRQGLESCAAALGAAPDQGPPRNGSVGLTGPHTQRLARARRPR